MSNQPYINVALADDHQIILDGLTSLLLDEKNIRIVGTGHNGNDIKKLLKSNSFHVLITDVKMPACDGLELTKWIKKEYPEIRVIALSMFHSISLIKKLLKAGVDGYLLKNTGKDEFIQSIYDVMEGKPYFTKDISDKIMRSMMINMDNLDENQVLPVSLTKRELEILELIVDEHTGPEIAKKLFISINTVETHRKNLLAKLKVKNTAGLVKYALKNEIFN